MPIFNSEFGVGIHTYMPMERLRGPLPDVDPDFFADFSLENDGILSLDALVRVRTLLTPPHLYFVVITPSHRHFHSTPID